MARKKMMLSACLAGINCVYDGTNKFHPVFSRIYKNNEALVFCPEVLGGLKIPHSPSEIVGGDGLAVLEGDARVLSREGEDVTDFFLKGARKVLKLAVRHGIKKVVLKSKSPSCGCGLIFDGSFSKKLIPGVGVTAALLKREGLKVVSDLEYLTKAGPTSRVACHTSKTKNLRLETCKVRRKSHGSKIKK